MQELNFGGFLTQFEEHKLFLGATVEDLFGTILEVNFGNCVFGDDEHIFKDPFCEVKVFSSNFFDGCMKGHIGSRLFPILKEGLLYPDPLALRQKCEKEVDMCLAGLYYIKKFETDIDWKKVTGIYEEISKHFFPDNLSNLIYSGSVGREETVLGSDIDFCCRERDNFVDAFHSDISKYIEIDEIGSPVQNETTDLKKLLMSNETIKWDMHWLDARPASRDENLYTEDLIRKFDREYILLNTESLYRKEKGSWKYPCYRLLSLLPRNIMWSKILSNINDAEYPIEARVLTKTRLEYIGIPIDFMNQWLDDLNTVQQARMEEHLLEDYKIDSEKNYSFVKKVFVAAEELIKLFEEK